MYPRPYKWGAEKLVDIIRASVLWVMCCVRLQDGARRDRGESTIYIIFRDKAKTEKEKLARLVFDSMLTRDLRLTRARRSLL